MGPIRFSFNLDLSGKVERTGGTHLFSKKDLKKQEKYTKLAKKILKNISKSAYIQEGTLEIKTDKNKRVFTLHGKEKISETEKKDVELKYEEIKGGRSKAMKYSDIVAQLLLSEDRNQGFKGEA